MAQGTIKKKADKGYGFITPKEGGKDIFFHASELRNVSFDELNEGDSVSYEPGHNDKGPRAQDVHRV